MRLPGRAWPELALQAWALAHGSGHGQGLFWSNVLKAKAFEVVVGLLIANEISYELLGQGIIFTLL